MGIWDRKSVELLRKSDHTGVHQLKRTLGASDLVLLGIGAIIGAGLFSITGIAAADNAGPAVIISFLIAALGCSFAALCYSEMAAMIPVSGSAYTYAYATLGELLAWIIGWDLILEYAIGAATVSISWSAYATSLMHDLNIHLPMQWLASPWQPVHLNDGTMIFGHANLPAVFIVVVLSFVLIWGIKQSAFINAIIVVLKISVVVVFIAIGVNHINPENYHPFIPENEGNFGRFGWSGVMRAAAIVFFAYIGFDAISTAAQETKNPQKNVPRGILGSLAICTVIYVAFSAVLVGLVNYKRLGVAAPIALAIDQTPYVWLNIAVKIAILAGFTSVILVMMLGQSRIFYSMAKDGLLPPMFADLHPRFDTPWRTNVVLMLLVALFGAFAPISLVGEMTSIGTLLAFTIVCASVLILRYQHPEIPRDFRTPWVPVIPLLGIFLCISMMAFLGWENWLRLLGWLLIGLVVYWMYGSRHSTLKR